MNNDDKYVELELYKEIKVLEWGNAKLAGLEPNYLLNDYASLSFWLKFECGCF